jgi:hypothetical protein
MVLSRFQKKKTPTARSINRMPPIKALNDSLSITAIPAIKTVFRWLLWNRFNNTVRVAQKFFVGRKSLLIHQILSLRRASKSNDYCDTASINFQE